MAQPLLMVRMSSPEKIIPAKLLSLLTNIFTEIRIGLAAGVLVLASVNSAHANSFTEAGFQQVYGLSIPNGATYNNSAPAYSVNNAGSIANGSFSRVAYYMELKKATDASLKWVWVSFDTPSSIASALGVPGNAGSNATFEQNVTNMNVFSSVGAGVTNGSGITTGNIEFWSSNYLGGANSGIGGNGGNYDFDDSQSSPDHGYGSMQIHNYGAQQTILAYNRWSYGDTSDLGIGNQVGGNPDYTFARNANTYTIKNLEVWVGNASSVPDGGSTLAMFGLALAGVVGLRRKFGT